MIARNNGIGCVQTRHSATCGRCGAHANPLHLQAVGQGRFCLACCPACNSGALADRTGSAVCVHTGSEPKRTATGRILEFNRARRIQSGPVRPPISGGEAA